MTWYHTEANRSIVGDLEFNHEPCGKSASKSFDTDAFTKKIGFQFRSKNDQAFKYRLGYKSCAQPMRGKLL